jgi:hypothetical protein
MWNAALMLVFAVVVSLGITGCKEIAAAEYILTGPPKNPAKFDLPEKTVVVFLDDRASVIMRSRLRDTIASTVTEVVVMQEQLVPKGIRSSAASQVASDESNGSLMAIDEIGRTVGAETVIYVVPTRFTLHQDGMPRPFASFLVKVIDAETGARLFPEDPNGHPVYVQMSYKGDSYYQGANRGRLEEQLAAYSGLRIAQVFFDHEVNPINAELNP